MVDPSGDPVTGGPTRIDDPLAGIFRSAAAYSPAWTAGYFTTGGMVDLELPGYSYEDGKSALAATVPITARLKQLMTARGFDSASFAWFMEAAATAGLWEFQYGGVGEFAQSWAAGTEYWDRQGTLWEHKPWWDKYKHEMLATAGMLLGATLIFAGGWPSWLIWGVAAAEAGVWTWDSIEYFQDGETTAALISLGFVLLPIAATGISAGARGTIRWIRISQEDFKALEAGRAVQTKAGEITPQMLNDIKTNYKAALSNPGGNAGTSAVATKFPSAEEAKIGQPYYDGVGRTKPVWGDIETLRSRWGVSDRQTVAVTKTDVPGLEGLTVETASARVRGEAGLPKGWDADPLLSGSDIQSPSNVLTPGRNHAEGGGLAIVDSIITREGIEPTAEGTVNLLISNADGPCPSCKSGFATAEAAPGPVMQFSLKYPNLTVVIESPGDVPDFVVRNGVKLS